MMSYPPRLSSLWSSYLQYVAVQRSHAYRAELMRNPPPAENVYGPSGNGSSTAYTAMNNTYRAPAELKTI